MINDFISYAVVLVSDNSERYAWKDAVPALFPTAAPAREWLEELNQRYGVAGRVVRVRVQIDPAPEKGIGLLLKERR